MTRDNNLFYFEITNTKLPSSKPVQNDFITTKGYLTNHGYGTQIIRDITRKYNGSVRYQDTQNKSSVFVTLQAWE